MKKENSTFANHSFCDMDRLPINYYPKFIHMTNGNKHFFVELKQNGSKFYCCNDYHPMNEDEFLFLMEEMKKYLDDKYNKRLPKDHFLFTKLPQRLKKDYDFILNMNKKLDEFNDLIVEDNLEDLLNKADDIDDLIVEDDDIDDLFDEGDDLDDLD